jgi:hypothetical protein
MKDKTEKYLSDKQLLDRITKTFFELFVNKPEAHPGWQMIHSICIPQTIIIKKAGLLQTVYDLNGFIEPRKKLLSGGTLIDFSESEIEEETKIVGNIAQRFSRYQKSGNLNGKHFTEYGNKFFQFVKISNGWKINAVIWEDDEI